MVPNVATNTDGRPYFKQWNSRSPYYIFHILSKWYVGPKLDQACTSDESACLSADDASAWPEGVVANWTGMLYRYDNGTFLVNDTEVLNQDVYCTTNQLTNQML